MTEEEFGLPPEGATDGYQLRRIKKIKEEANNPSQAKPGGYAYDQQYFFYRTPEENKKVDIDTILYLEAQGNYVQLHFSSGRPLLIRATLEGLSGEFPEFMFVRISRTHHVAARYITAWSKTYVKIGEIQLPVSKSGYLYLEDRLQLLGIF